MVTGSKNKNSTYLVFVVQGYDDFNEQTDLMRGVVSFELIAKSEAEAMAAAKKILNKNGYRLNAVIEKYRYGN